MKDQAPPEHVTRFVESMIEVAAEFAQIMDHMYRHVSDFPDAPAPPIVARNLVAGVLESTLARRKRQVQTATDLLRQARDAISEEIYLVEPGAFDDLTDDFEPEFTSPDPGDIQLNGHHEPGGERLH